MSIATPENPLPPMPENKDANKETPPETPEPQQETEISNEQLEQYTESVEIHFEQEAAEVVPEAENNIESSVKNMNVSPEITQAAKEEQGLDAQLEKVQTEADQLSSEAKSEINSVMEREKSPEAKKGPNLERIEKNLRRLEQEGKLPPKKSNRYMELLSQLDDRVLEKLTLFYNKPKLSNPAAGNWFLGNVGVYPEQEDRVFMHEIGHHIFDGGRYFGENDPDFMPPISPETTADIETLFHNLNDDEKSAILATRNRGWNSKPNEWFAQAFGTWINKQMGSKNVDSPKYESLKKAFESVLAKKKEK